jgi:hypothetical protein
MEVVLFLWTALGEVPGGECPVNVAPYYQATLTPPPPDGVPIGTLWARDLSFGGIPYVPQEGDILLFGSITPIYSIIFPIARSWHPWHSTVVVRRTTGDLAVFEIGGDSHPYGALRPVGERLPNWMTKTYYRPRCWVRRIKQPLNPKESAALTTFVETQAYKPFTTNRHLLTFVLPGRPLLESYPDREKWFCTEMFMEGLVAAGILSPRQVPRPEALAPRDIFLDIRVDLSGRWDPPLVYSSNDRPPPPGPPLGPP